MTPKGVADVLSEADAFLARIARLREENSHPVALYVDASEADQVVRALALHCAEQETECDAMEQFAKLNKERARKAEARCVELEDALRQYADPRNWAVRRSEDFEHPSCVWIGEGALLSDGLAIARATLTPTVDQCEHRVSIASGLCLNCGDPLCLRCEGLRYDTEGGLGTSYNVPCPGCKGTGLAEPLSEGVTEPASSASGGQARDDEVTVSKPAYGRALLLLDGVPRSDLSSNQEYAPPGTAAWVAKAVEVLTKLTSRGAPTEEEEQG